ncbi:hypothetical protein Q5O89_01715 [Peribacillus frigoritolerans]|nr:hypothetical protein [Peribacillus frigoritolerans]
MKRYLCSIIIGMVVILSIGTYYVKVASSASSLPKYTFKTLEGSDKELDPVIINASLQNSSNFYEPLTIESNTTTYESERSYLENLTGRQGHEIERLVKEHRSFMRGKDSISSLYEDDDFLAYAWVNSEYTKSGNMEAKFDIGLLEKKDEEETSFQIELPNQGRIMNADVRDVQLVHSKLQVLTMNDVNSNSEQTKEVHLYTIDIANKKVLSDKTLVSESFTYPDQVDFEMPIDVAPSMPNNMVFISLIKGVNHEDGSFEEKLKESKLLSYNYETEKLETVKKESLSLDMARSGYSDGKNLYAVEMKSGKYRIKTFDFSSQTLTNDKELDIAANKEDQYTAAFKNGRVYFLLNRMNQEGKTNKPAKLLIADIKTGKTLYKGETVMNKKNSKIFGLFIDDLEIK